MGQRIETNFYKRFKGRVSVVFSDRPLPSIEQKTRNDAIAKAISEVMAEILKREPTQEELLGLEDISVHKRRRRK